jgi:hypothetical protein
VASLVFVAAANVTNQVNIVGGYIRVTMPVPAGDLSFGSCINKLGGLCQNSPRVLTHRHCLLRQPSPPPPPLQIVVTMLLHFMHVLVHK